MYEFTDPAARELIAHVLDTHPDGQSLLTEADHRRTLAQQSARGAAEAFAMTKAARLGYEALRHRLDPRYGRTMHAGVAAVALAVVIAALLGLDRIEFAGILAGWMTAAAAAAATAAWAGCAWLAALAVREERRGRLIVIAAGAAAAGLLLAALHSAGSAVLRWPGWHPVWVSILMVLVILILVTTATEIITRTEPALAGARAPALASRVGRVPGCRPRPALGRRSRRGGSTGMVQPDRYLRDGPRRQRREHRRRCRWQPAGRQRAHHAGSLAGGVADVAAMPRGNGGSQVFRATSPPPSHSSRLAGPPMPAPRHPVNKRTTIPQATAKGATMAIVLDRTRHLHCRGHRRRLSPDHHRHPQRGAAAQHAVPLGPGPQQPGRPPGDGPVGPPADRLRASLLNPGKT